MQKQRRFNPPYIGQAVHWESGINRLEEDERALISIECINNGRGVSPLHTPRGTQNMAIVNELGLYTLLFCNESLVGLTDYPNITQLTLISTTQN